MDIAAFTKRNSLFSGRFQTKTASGKSDSSPAKTVLACAFTKKGSAPSSIKTPQTAHVRRTKKTPCDVLPARGKNKQNPLPGKLQSSLTEGLI